MQKTTNYYIYPYRYISEYKDALYVLLVCLNEF